jgi:hypothetical protein
MFALLTIRYELNFFYHEPVRIVRKIIMCTKDELIKSVGGRPKQKSKAILGKKAQMRKATARRKDSMRACRIRPNDGRVRVLVMYCNG